MKRSLKSGIAALCALAALSLPMLARADHDHEHAHGNTQCPVGLVSGMTLNAEFGDGASMLTRCIKNRHHVRLVIEINRYCRDDDAAIDADGKCAGGADALGNMKNIIADYKTTYGMVQGRDYKIVAVVHGMGGRMLLNNTGPNPAFKNAYMADVQAMMNEGVTFYFCQNTVRGFIRGGLIGSGDAVNEVIPGVKFVTAGFTALSDFQSLGWTQVTP